MAVVLKRFVNVWIKVNGCIFYFTDYMYCLE